MTLDELKVKLEEENNEFEKKCSKLKIELEDKKSKLMENYTKENHRFEIGDIISSCDRYIKVESFRGEISKSGKFYVTYFGPELTKKLQPRKDEFKTCFYDDGREITKIEKK